MEEHSNWSQFSLLDHDDLLLQAIEAHIKSILQPYDIKFTKVHSYKRWQGTCDGSFFVAMILIRIRIMQPMIL